MSPNRRREQIRRQLADALEHVEAELTKCRCGQDAIDSEQRLVIVAEGLEMMLSSLTQPTRPEPPGLWRIVTDTWPYDSPLARKVVDAEYAYQRLE